MPHYSSKTYTHATGLSCCFRQWRADSHCRFLHGYALEVALRFRADVLDDRRWVMDFGGLAEVKAFLVDTFDHTTLVAADDPERPRFEALREAGLVDLRVVPDAGCEAFARLIFDHVDAWLRAHPDERVRGRVRLDLVEVREHGGNSAAYSPDADDRRD